MSASRTRDIPEDVLTPSTPLFAGSQADENADPDATDAVEETAVEAQPQEAPAEEVKVVLDPDYVEAVYQSELNAGVEDAEKITEARVSVGNAEPVVVSDSPVSVPADVVNQLIESPAVKVAE